MDDVKRYWRDMVASILKWSVGIYLLVAGWSIDKHDQFELACFDIHNFDKGNGKGLRAAGLLLMTVIYIGGLHLIVWRIYARYLGGTVDGTVLSQRAALIFCFIVSLLTLSVVGMTAIY